LSATEVSKLLTLLPESNQRLALLTGHLNEYLNQIEKDLKVSIHNRGHQFEVSGPPEAVENTIEVLKSLYEETAVKKVLTAKYVYMVIQSIKNKALEKTTALNHKSLYIQTRRLKIKPHTANQYRYVDRIISNDINFGIGPAGTGKTYLAVACAISAFDMGKVQRIILTRPAVEAGERLGFLPGSLVEKIDPYLRPLYDALFEMLGVEETNHLLERNVIEIAPLAYMRGRTLKDAFIILDESQNTTREQMQMFLTRMSFGSKSVITGDLTQIDLPRNVESGLKHAVRLLSAVEGIKVTHFEAEDVMRHPLIQKIVQIYAKDEKYHD
jgi:phosphate starvation-inducible protein PhoH and related proteins